MRMVDLIVKKREKKSLSVEEINFIIKGYTKGEIPDYQMSAMNMAILFNDMTNKETVALTAAIVASGEVVDLSKVKGSKVDKHSTGGVGDKTTLILAPMMAAMGLKVAKLSGRGLGHTGGTIDKLESIDGFNVELTNNQFIKQVNKIGVSVIGQTKNLTPADKKLYALRDVTGTVESIPLIASSIMSKKIASGADNILLDVKVGSGAFMKDIVQAKKLAKTMVGIGKGLNRNTTAMITNMEQPLGLAVGNALEVREAVETLQGNGPADIHELCVEASALLGYSSKKFKTIVAARRKAEAVIKDGSALKVFHQFIKAQGGNNEVLTDLEKFTKAKYNKEILATKSAYIKSLDALSIGNASMMLGAGRTTKEDVLDMKAGILLTKKVGDKVKKGEVLFTMKSSKKISEAAIKLAKSAFKYSTAAVKKPKIVVTTIK